MGSYWIKIEESVEGPYETHTLKFIEGFTPETLVSPETSEAEETWMKASEVPELREILGIQAEPIAKTLSGTEASPELPPAISKEIPEKESWPEKVILEEPKTQSPQPESPAVQDEIKKNPPEIQISEPLPSPLQKIDAPPLSDSDILEVMEKISEELKKEEKKEAVLVSAVPAVPIPKEIAEPEFRTFTPRSKKLKIIVAGIGLASIVAAGIFWKPRSAWELDFFSAAIKKFTAWTKQETDKIYFWKKSTEQTKIEPVQKIPVPEKPAETKMEKIELPPKEVKPKGISYPKPKPIARQKVVPSTPPSAAAEARQRRVSKSTVTEIEKELKTEKYLLPGVPSPPK